MSHNSWSAVRPEGFGAAGGGRSGGTVAGSMSPSGRRLRKPRSHIIRKPVTRRERPLPGFPVTTMTRGAPGHRIRQAASARSAAVRPPTYG